MGSDVFFHGLMEGETAEISVDEGKNLIVTLVEIGKIKEDGKRSLTFEINGLRRSIEIEDKTKRSNTSLKAEEVRMASDENKSEVGSSIPGTIVKVLVKGRRSSKRISTVDGCGSYEDGN